MNALAPGLDQRLQLALKASQDAALITLKYFLAPDLEIERKGDEPPVTIADRQAEQCLRNEITEVFPDDAILGEEFPDREGKSGFRWVLDPIDGTKSFIHGVPLYGTLVGLEFDSEPVLGVIRIPGTTECVYAAKGQGAWYTDGKKAPRPAQVSNCTKLSQGLLLTSEPISFDKIDKRPFYHKLETEARLSRTWGDCYGYMMVATGRADVMIDPIMAIWDAAALLPILQEAGGTFTDWQGKPTIHSGQGIGTNGRLLDEILGVMSDFE